MSFVSSTKSSSRPGSLACHCCHRRRVRCSLLPQWTNNGGNIGGNLGRLLLKQYFVEVWNLLDEDDDVNEDELPRSPLVPFEWKAVVTQMMRLPETERRDITWRNYKTVFSTGSTMIRDITPSARARAGAGAKRKGRARTASSSRRSTSRGPSEMGARTNRYKTGKSMHTNASKLYILYTDATTFLQISEISLWSQRGLGRLQCASRAFQHRRQMKTMVSLIPTCRYQDEYSALSIRL